VFSNLVWETGVTTEFPNDLVIPRGYLQPGTKYYWRVKVQDELGYWSVFSATTAFTTVKSFSPDKPENISPANGAGEIAPTGTFISSEYYDADGDAQYAMQARIMTNSGDGSSEGQPLWEAILDTSGTFSPPEGLLEYSKTYTWQVRYQDDTGLWSLWSEKTSFTTMANLAPNQPVNEVPVNDAEAVDVPVTLSASSFSDPNAGDEQSAARWQIRTASGNYTSPVYDSDNVTASLTSFAVPEDSLAASTKYYWHVRYQDSYGNWSAYSTETSFTTGAIGAVVAPTAGFFADKSEVTAGAGIVTFTDNSTGKISSWSWDFGDNVTVNWTASTRPSNGQVRHTYTVAGAKNVKLTVVNAAGTDEEVKDAYVVVHAKPEANILGPATAKAGKEVTFKDESSPTGDITSWEWQFDDGTTEQWTAAQREAAGGQIKHVFQKAGKHTVSLIVKGALGESYYNKQITVTGGGGFQFGLWMIGVALAAVVVVAGVVYLVRARKGK
jgi:PKD repeat protein